MPKKLSNYKKVWKEIIHKHVIYDLKKYNVVLSQVNSYDLTLKSNEELQLLSRNLREKAKKGESPEHLLPEAFALAREAACRVSGMRPFDVQVLAGIGLHYRMVVEMQTGEGKTLAAVLPAYLNALSGKGVHILTFNDYLARRDAVWMGPIYEFLGLTVGYIQEGMSILERRKAYAADITYLTAKEAGFDFLRDHLCFHLQELVHRSFHFAIVDEADSILIDEARIPLVIAGNSPSYEQNAYPMAQIVKTLTEGIHYDRDEFGRNVYMTDAGLEQVESILGCGNLYAPENIELLTAMNSALHAYALIKRDVDYIVRDGKVELVDEFTGRIADKRHWPDGLQAAIEAKEGLALQPQGRILGSVTLQNFLLHYPGLSGMTATAQTSADELAEFYNLEVVVIPPNRPYIREDHPDRIFTHKEAKVRAVIDEIIKVHATGRPILIGTASVQESDDLAQRLKTVGVNCHVLNAKNDALEAAIIARAGECHAVTVSTNMAGRGTDIHLGGLQEEARDHVVALGGLYVIGLNRHESRRIDNQLRGRAGRQGDPGESRFFISLEDDLIKQFGIGNVLPSPLCSLRQETPLENKLIVERIAHVQKVMEGQNFEVRRTLCKYAFIVEEQRRSIAKKRQEILFKGVRQSILAAAEPHRYRQLADIVGEKEMQRLEQQLTLYQIDQCWATHLDYIAYVREGIHLVSISQRSPLDEFHRLAIEAFASLPQWITKELIHTFCSLQVTENGVDLERQGIKGPSSTWTYLISDDYFINTMGMKMASARNLGFATMAVSMYWPLVLWMMIQERFFKKVKAAK